MSAQAICKRLVSWLASSLVNVLASVRSAVRQEAFQQVRSGQKVRPPAAFESYSEAGRKFRRGEIRITQLDLKELPGKP
jgi:hypothetical protein